MELGSNNKDKMENFKENEKNAESSTSQISIISCLNIDDGFTEKERKHRKSQIKRLFDNAFSNDKEWNNWFFDKVYNDDEAIQLEVDGKTVSCLFLQHYDFRFHDRILGLGYVAGATTDYKMRHHGYMGHLLHEALHVAFERGETFVGLIPAERRLFFLYDKYGFATVVFADIQRYTSLHSFPFSDEYQIVEPSYEAFRELEDLRSSTVVHSASDFENILYDVRHDGGTIVQINDIENRPMAMAFGASNGSEIHVKELLGVNPRANDMALGEVRNKLAVELPMAVWRLPSGRQASLRKRGMMRVVNAEMALRALAEAHPNLSKKIRVSDPLIAQNNATFTVSQGKCRRVEDNVVDGVASVKVDFDVTIDVLTKILFSSNSIGNILGIPASHPAMSLMLD